MLTSWVKNEGDIICRDHLLQALHSLLLQETIGTSRVLQDCSNVNGWGCLSPKQKGRETQMWVTSIIWNIWSPRQALWSRSYWSFSFGEVKTTEQCTWFCPGALYSPFCIVSCWLGLLSAIFSVSKFWGLPQIILTHCIHLLLPSSFIFL